VKKIRNMCRTIAAMKTLAAQWWVCRIRRPPLTLVDRSSTERYACVISCPRSGAYAPW
jgi:hypothetical protein